MAWRYARARSAEIRLGRYFAVLGNALYGANHQVQSVIRTKVDPTVNRINSDLVGDPCSIARLSHALDTATSMRMLGVERLASGTLADTGSRTIGFD